MDSIRVTNTAHLPTLTAATASTATEPPPCSHQEDAVIRVGFVYKAPLDNLLGLYSAWIEPLRLY